MGSKLYSFGNCFKERLKSERKKTYKTQEEFADAMGVSTETVRNWEQGRTYPEINTLFEICELLNCDIDYLIGKIDCKTHDIQFISEQTGLTQDAILNLAEWNKMDDRRQEWGQVLSDIITHNSFPQLMGEICDLLGFKKIEQIGYSILSESDLSNVHDSETARLWQLSRVFTNIIEDLK